MSKNYHIKYCLIFLFVFLLSGCEKFLEEKLYGDMAGNTFPTENTAETLLNAAYQRAVHACMDHHRLFWPVEFAGPQLMYKFRAGGGRGYFDRWDWGSSPAFYDLFDRLFYTVRSCNDAIGQVPELEMDDTERQAEIVGEAKFIRALMYFYMVRLWGGMPILDKAQTLSDDLYPVRASIAETYAFIVKDLQDAAAALPHRSDFVERGLLGHATKEAALGTLAKVYITMAGEPLGDNSHLTEAKTILEEIITSGEQKLLDDYAAVFDWQDDNNEEFLFAWQSEGDDQAFAAYYYFIPQKGSYLYMPENRPGITYDLVEPEFAIKYMENDSGPRFQWNIAIEYYEENGTYHYFLDGPENAAYCVKYRCADATTSGVPNNFPVMRYSEVLLLHSEVVNELNGPTNEAYSGINQVRARAQLDPLPAGLTKDEFRDKIFLERELELCFEQHSLFDIRRRGYEYAKELMENYYNPTQNGYTQWEITVEEREMLYPILQTYLDDNPNLTQNPGY